MNATRGNAPILLYFSFLIMCSEGNTVSDTDSTDSSSDTDIDGDGDADTDADGDADTDADGDADTDADGDADSDADTDADGDADSDADTDADSDADTDADGDADSDADTDADSDADTDADGDADTDADGDADTDADGDADTDADGDADTETTIPEVNGNLAVQFTFQTSLRGRAMYLWVEDVTGNYIDTIQQYFGRNDGPGYDETGERYPNDNPVTWKTAVGETDTLVVDGITGASPNGTAAPPGSYTAAPWDCRDVDGNALPRGDYVVWLEVCVDHESGHPLRDVFLYSAPITLGDAGQSIDLSFVRLSVDIDSNGEAPGITHTDVVASAAAVFTPSP